MMKGERYDLSFDGKYDVCGTCPNKCEDYENYYYQPDKCTINGGEK